MPEYSSSDFLSFKKTVCAYCDQINSGKIRVLGDNRIIPGPGLELPDWHCLFIKNVVTDHTNMEDLLNYLEGFSQRLKYASMRNVVESSKMILFKALYEILSCNLEELPLHMNKEGILLCIVSWRMGRSI